MDNIVEIMVKNANTSLDYDKIADFLYEYILELHEIEHMVKLRSRSELITEYFYTPDTEYQIIYMNLIPIGFAILGHYTNCPDNADVYIEEFFIAKEYRRRGYGKEAALKIIEKYKSICFYELKKNIVAQRFWNNILKDKWVNFNETLIPENTPDYLGWYSYSKKTK